MWVILVVVVTGAAVGALDTSNLTGDAILNRILDEVLEDVPEPRFGISRTQWVMTGMSETWSQYSSTSGSTFGAGVAEYYGAGAAASISGPDGIMRTRYNSLYPGFGFTGEWIMLPRQHKRFQYENQYKHSDINVNVLMSQLWASVILRDNIVTVFGYILNRPSNFLSEELYTSLYHIYDAIRLRRVQIYGLIQVLQDVSFGSPTEQFLYIFEGLSMVVPRYLLGAVQIWIDTLRLEPPPLDEVMRPNGGPLVVDFLAGIEASVIRILREPIEWNPFTARKKNAVLSNLMGPVFVEIFAALEEGSLALTQPLFGLILINRPLNEVIPEKDETERYLVDILRLGNVESWEKIIKPVTKKDRGDPDILIPKVLTQISVSKETDVLIREEARYIIPYLKPPSNTYANKYYNTVSPVLSKPSIDLLLLLKSITKVEYPLEVVEDKERIVHFILDGHLDIEFIVKGFNRFDHDTPINVLIALLTRIERRLPKLPPEIISSVRSLQLYLVYRRFLCSMSSTIPLEFLDISSLTNAFANVRIPTHVYVLVQKLVVTLPYEDVPWRELIKEVSIEECTRPRKCIYHFFKLVLERNYITKGPSFKILVELMGYLNEDGDPWEMVTEDKSTSQKYCVPLPETTPGSKMTTMFTKPWPTTWGTTRYTERTTTLATVARQQSSTVKSITTEETSKGIPTTETAEHSSNTESCDEDIFTMEATTETQPRRKHTTVRSTESRSSTDGDYITFTSRTLHPGRLRTTEGNEGNTDSAETVTDEDRFSEAPRVTGSVEDGCSDEETSTKSRQSTRTTENVRTEDGGVECSSDSPSGEVDFTEDGEGDDGCQASTRRSVTKEVTKQVECSSEEDVNCKGEFTTKRSSKTTRRPRESIEESEECGDNSGDSEACRESGGSDEIVSTDSDSYGESSEERDKTVESCEEETTKRSRTTPTGKKVTKHVYPKSSTKATNDGVQYSTEKHPRTRHTESVKKVTDSTRKASVTTKRQRFSSTPSYTDIGGQKTTKKFSTGSWKVTPTASKVNGKCYGPRGEEIECSGLYSSTTESSSRTRPHAYSTSKYGTRSTGFERTEEEPWQETSTTPDEELYPTWTEKSRWPHWSTPSRKSTTSTRQSPSTSFSDWKQSSNTEGGSRTKAQTYSTSKYVPDGTRSTGISSTEEEAWLGTKTTPEEELYPTWTEKSSWPHWSTPSRKSTTSKPGQLTSSWTQTQRSSTRQSPSTSFGDWKQSSNTEGGSRTKAQTYSTSKYVPDGTRSTGTAWTEEEPWLGTNTTPEEELHPTWTEKSAWPHWSTPSRKSTTSKPGQLTSSWTQTQKSSTRQSPSTSFGDWKQSSNTEGGSRTKAQTYSTSKYVPDGTRSTGTAWTEEEPWLSTNTTPEEELHPTWTEKSSWPHWSTPSRKTTSKPGQLTSSWTQIQRSTTARPPFTNSWPDRTVTWTRNFTTTKSPAWWSFPTRAQSSPTATSNSWSSWQTWTPSNSRQTTANRADASTSRPRVGSTLTPGTSPWQINWNGSWPQWNGTFFGSTPTPPWQINWNESWPQWNGTFFGSTPTPPWQINWNESWPQWNGTFFGSTPTPPWQINWNGSWPQWNGTFFVPTPTPPWQINWNGSWPQWNGTFFGPTPTPPWQINWNGSWPQWNGTFLGPTPTPPWQINWNGTWPQWNGTFFGPTPTPPWQINWNGSWPQWNGTFLGPTPTPPWQINWNGTWPQWNGTFFGPTQLPPWQINWNGTWPQWNGTFFGPTPLPPWQINWNGSWPQWNGTFLGPTPTPPWQFNWNVSWPQWNGAEVPPPRGVVLNGSWVQWNGTWSHWNSTSSRPQDGTPSWGGGMPNITWPKLNFTSMVGFGVEMNWSLSYLLRESKIFTSEFVIDYVKKIHSQGRYSIQYMPTPEEIDNAKFPSFDVVHSMEPPSVEHPETCLVPTQYGTLEDFKLKPLRFLLSSPELYQYLGPDFNPAKYSTKGELLLAILERFVQIQAVQTNTNIYSYISNYINSIRESKHTQGPSVTINFVSLLNALPFAVSEQEVRYLTRITDFMSASEFYKLLGPTFNPSKHKTRGPMLKYTFELMMTLSIVQEDKFLLEALRYFVGKIYMQGYGGQAVEWVLMREVDQVQAVDVRSVFRAINHDKLSKSALQAESNVLNFIFNEFIPSVHFQDFKVSQFKTKGQLLQGAFRYLLTQNTVNPKVKADIITLMPYIRFDGPGVEPVDYDPFSV